MSAPNEIQLAAADWDRLREMRAGFLFASEHAADTLASYGIPLEDYWRSRRDLEIYDATLGARIGWKWRAVIAEIRRHARVNEWEPPSGLVLDFGCGTGVASRAWLAEFGASVKRVRLHDRSAAARAFALERVRAESPGTNAAASTLAGSDRTPDVLLASHVLDELDADGRDELLRLARASRLVVWVESAAKATSRALSRLRDELLEEFEPLLPCTHRARCGALAEGRADEWCHHFATPAPESFTTAHWRRFSEELSVDLRSLPYSYLVLARRSEAQVATPRRDEGLSRLIGRPEQEKGRLLLHSCDASGVRKLVLLQRTDKRLARALAKGEIESLLFRWRVEGDRITAIEPIQRAPDGP